MEPAVRDIHRNEVAISNNGQWPALGRFWRDVPHKATAVRPGEAAIGHQRRLSGQSAAVEELHGDVHLAHAGAPFWPFVADDDHLPFRHPPLQNCLVGSLLHVEAARLAGEGMHARIDGRRLGDCRIGRQVAPQGGQSAALRPGLLVAPDDVPVAGHNSAHIVRHRLAGDGQRVPVQKRKDLVHYCGHTSRRIEIGHVGRCGRVHPGDVRRRPAERFKLAHRQLDAGFVGQRQQVEDGVGRAPDGRVQADGILQRLLVDDVTGHEALAHHLYDPPARFLGGAQTVGPGGRNGCAAGQAHAQPLSQAAHRVRRPQKRAGSARRRNTIFQAIVGRPVDLTHLEHGQPFGDRGGVGGAAVELAAAFRRPADHQDGRDIQAGCRHQHAGHDLVT